MTDTESPPSYVVGIGASARGLEAVQAFLAAVDDEPGMAFVVVQHLSPDHESNLVELLRNSTELTVETAEDGTVVESDHVYVIAPGQQLSLRDGVLCTEELPQLESGRDTIDFFFRSLAEELEEGAVGVLLSGAGSDGTAGLRLIKRYGGISMAQDPDEAGVESMPASAIREGVVDFVGPVAELPERLAEVTSSGRSFGSITSPDDLADYQEDALHGILQVVREESGNDLSEYKRSTLLRRIVRRMQIENIDSLEGFQRFLESHPGKVDALLDDMLIKVTGFFRDPGAWQTLERDVLPTLFEGKGPDDEVRVWVAGCSTGEEAYTVAMLVHHYAEQLRRPPEIKVFATDIDRDAIEYAREGIYPSAVASDVPIDYLKRYFEVEDGEYRVVEKVRNRVLFAPQNALTDPPFSNLDLITCRNLLIYLQSEAQRQLLRLLHYGLAESGFLMLGASESPSRTSDLFDSFDETHRIYRLKPGDSGNYAPGTVFGFSPSMVGSEVEEETASARPTTDTDLDELHRDAALKAQRLGSVLVDRDRRLIHTIGETSPYLSVPMGEPSDDILEMVVERFRPVVRNMLFEAFAESEETVTRRVPENEEAGAPAVDVRAKLLDTTEFEEPVVSLSFRPISPSMASYESTLAEEATDDAIVDRYERQIAQLRERLQETTREYEASNQQLRASNEELMSMNEELQSTTEELETSKEELQSLNEELQTVNSELNEKIRELDAVNSDLRNLMRSTDIGTLFLDRQLEIERYTEPVTQLFNIKASDEGRPLQHLTHHLKTDELVDHARSVLDDLKTVEREIETEDGRWFLVRVLPYLTVDDSVDGVVLTFIDVTERRQIQDELAEREEKFRTVFESAADPMVIYRVEDGTPQSFIDVNAAAIEKTGMTREQLEDLDIDDLLAGDLFDLETHLDQLDRDGEASVETRLLTNDPDVSIPVEATATRMALGDDATVVVEVLRDISAQRRYEEALLESKERAEELAELRSMFLSTLSHDVRSPLSTILMTVAILRERVDDDEVELLDSVERSCRQLQRILDSILRMAKLESRESAALPEEFDVVENVREVVELYEPIARNDDLRLEYDGPESPTEVRLDPRFLTQILNNLVDNAIKYTDEGGVDVRLEVDDDSVAISVVDTGIGISEGDQAVIFERFETASDLETKRFDSTGLGLAIMRLLVDAMEGSVELESTPGEGSTFTVTFPRRLSTDYESGEADRE